MFFGVNLQYLRKVNGSMTQEKLAELPRLLRRSCCRSQIKGTS